MNRFFKISALILAYLLFSAKSCDNHNGEKTGITASIDSIRKEFQADNIREESLGAFETNARQKLSDFSDYLQLFMSPSIDSLFRDKTRDMIRDIFISDSVSLRFLQNQGTKDQELTLAQLLKNGLRNESMHSGFIFDSVKVYRPFTRISDTVYSGSLDFSQKLIRFSLQDTAVIRSEIKTADVFIVKRDKIFGKDTLRIWKVLLGNIK